MRWSERRTVVRSTFEMTSTLALRATRALARRRSSCSRQAFADRRQITMLHSHTRAARIKTRHSGLALVEVLVIAAILLLLISLSLRLRYGQQWLAAEYSFVHSLGISSDTYAICKLAIFAIALLWYVVYRIRRASRH